MGEYSDKPGYAFNPGPPPEVASFFGNKSLKPSFSFEDVEPMEHAVSFTVAKAMQVDVLEAIQEELKKALEEGVPYRQFAKDLEPRLRKLGWWGVKEMRDPVTGEMRKVRLGSPRRLKTIYRANMRSARAAGQWDRIQRTKKALPYLMYLLGPSEKHRPHHQAKAGMVLPVDDPFWRAWYPPNGWGCKCHVRQITRREAERRGISQSPRIETREELVARTGEIKEIPIGIDAGWEMNPGAYRQANVEAFLRDKLNTTDPAVARAAARDMAGSWRVRRIHDGSATGAVPVAMLPDDLARSLGSSSRVVQFSDYTAAKGRAKHPEVLADSYQVVTDLLDNGELRLKGDKHLLLIGEGDLPWVAVIKRTLDGSENYLSTLYRASSSRYLARLRAGSESVRN